MFVGKWYIKQIKACKFTHKYNLHVHDILHIFDQLMTSAS